MKIHIYSKGLGKQLIAQTTEAAMLAESINLEKTKMIIATIKAMGFYAAPIKGTSDRIVYERVEE